MSCIPGLVWRALLGASHTSSRGGVGLLGALSSAVRSLAGPQRRGSRLFSLSHEFDPRDVERVIRKVTTVTTDHLTPELKLHLITPDCELWTAEPASCPLPDPYWAFYWPGGQALTRYILDHPHIVAGRSVVDVGCGCGSGAIAAAIAGAAAVLANDIDPVALVATRLNADVNGTSILYSSENFLECSVAASSVKSAANTAMSLEPNAFDVVLLGDMLYSDDFAEMLFHWALSLARLGKHVYVGDPGRDYVRRLPPGSARNLARFQLPESCVKANSGFTDAAVLQLFPSVQAGDTQVL